MTRGLGGEGADMFGVVVEAVLFMLVLRKLEVCSPITTLLFALPPLGVSPGGRGGVLPMVVPRAVLLVVVVVAGPVLSSAFNFNSASVSSCNSSTTT